MIRLLTVAALALAVGAGARDVLLRPALSAVARADAAEAQVTLQAPSLL